MFVNHHLHSCYSLLDCPTKVESIVDVLQQRGENCVNITDHGTLGASYTLWKECNKRKMKPILSCEAFVVESYKPIETKEDKYNYGHLILMSMNPKGWENLKLLQSFAWEKGFTAKPRISMQDLRMHNEGLIATTGCISSLPAKAYLKTDSEIKEASDEKARKIAFQRVKELVGIFGNRLYGEVQLNELDQQIKYNDFVIRVCAQLGVKIIVTGDTHYISTSDRIAQDALVCMNWRDRIDINEDGSVINHCYDTRELWLKTEGEMFDSKDKFHSYISNDELNKYIQEATNLANRIEQFPILKDTDSLPKYNCGSSNPNQLIIKKCKEHRDWSKVKNIPEYKKRFWEEWRVLYNCNFSDYFLVVNDIVHEARRRKIPYNCRGSVCGSLISYLLGISWVDPIRFNTPFERFLTEDRQGLPDIDMDFSKQRREEMIQYLEEKYGKDRVVHIVNIVRFQPKTVIKDMARVFGLNFHEVNKLTERIPDNYEWNDIVKMEGIADLFNKNSKMMDICEKLLGVNRHNGVHASGIILTPSKCTDWVPISYALDKNNSTGKRCKTTEWDMYTLEELNILKLDFLGLNTLDVVSSTIDKINKNYSNSKFHDLDSLYEYVLKHSDDRKVYEMIAQGDTIGTFQLGTSDGMIELGRKLKVSNLKDIAVLISLYRTAVLEAGMHEVYYRRKILSEDYELAHPKMHEVLDETYGVLVFQYQSMKLAQAIAGFSESKSDHFRKGIKQKDSKKLKVWKNDFINGCKKHSNISNDKSEEIWGFIESFAKYGFGKCLASDTVIHRGVGALIYQTENVEHLFKLKNNDAYARSCKQLHYRLKLVERGYGKIAALGADGSIQLKPIKDIFYNGKKLVFEITLKNGLSVAATSSHKFMTRDYKYKTVALLNVGDELIIDPLLDSEQFNFSAIKSIKQRGVESVYDIEMDSDEHNFIANGIVSHNSHATSYALLGYITCFLKANYPIEYYSGLLTNNISNEKKLCRYLTDTKKRNIKLYYPHINISNNSFNQFSDGIIYPLTAVKNVGQKAIKSILIERRKNGKFKSLKDFYNRIDKHSCNIRVFCNLILAGVFRQFTNSVEEAWDAYFELRNVDKNASKDAKLRQVYCKKCDRRQPVRLIRENKNITSDNNYTCPVCGDYNLIIDATQFRNKKFDVDYIMMYVFGFSLTYDKLNKFKNEIDEYECELISELSKKSEGEYFRTAFVVNSIKTHIDKRGNEMAFLDIADESGSCSLIVFSEAWSIISDRCVKGVCATGLFNKNDGNNLMASSFHAWDFNVLGI